MLCVGAEKEVASYEDLGKARLQRDEEDVLMLVSHFGMTYFVKQRI